MAQVTQFCTFHLDGLLFGVELQCEFIRLDRLRITLGAALETERNRIHASRLTFDPQIEPIELEMPAVEGESEARLRLVVRRRPALARPRRLQTRRLCLASRLLGNP